MNNFLFRVCGVAAVLVFDAPSAIQAAPVTFGFEATISEIRGVVTALNLPFSLAEGVQIEGRYVFQSEGDLLGIFPPRGTGTQGRVTLLIDGTEIEALTNFGVLNDGGPVDINNPPPPEAMSSISLGYISPTDVFPGWGGQTSGHPWGASLALVGSDGTITVPEDILDVEIWNQLTILRQLDFQFGFFQSGVFNIVTARATVGDFVVVPEPSCVKLVVILLIIELICLLLKRYFVLRSLPPGTTQRGWPRQLVVWVPTAQEDSIGRSIL